MRKTEPYRHETDGEPEACFATDAEIEIADKLRHQLEERYLATSAPVSPPQERSDDTR